MLSSQSDSQAWMKVLDRERLERFCRRHADARGWLENWLADVQGAGWSSPQDVRRRYASASFLADNVVIFNVKGNTYRLEVTVAYRTGVVVVEWIGTHAAYDERNKQRR
jgi:mRNA interferase HigB